MVPIGLGILVLGLSFVFDCHKGMQPSSRKFRECLCLGCGVCLVLVLAPTLAFMGAYGPLLGEVSFKPTYRGPTQPTTEREQLQAAAADLFEFNGRMLPLAVPAAPARTSAQAISSAFWACGCSSSSCRTLPLGLGYAAKPSETWPKPVRTGLRVPDSMLDRCRIAAGLRERSDVIFVELVDVPPIKGKLLALTAVPYLLIDLFCIGWAAACWWRPANRRKLGDCCIECYGWFSFLGELLKVCD